MPQCLKCSQPSPDGSQHCVNCGAQLDPGAAHRTQLGMPIIDRATQKTVGGSAFSGGGGDPQVTMPGKPSLLAGLPRPRVRSGGSPLSQNPTPMPMASNPALDARSTVMGMPLLSLPPRPDGPDQTLPQRPSVKKAPAIQTLSSFDLHAPDQGSAANTQPEVVPAHMPREPAAPEPAAPQPVAPAAAQPRQPVDPTAVTQPHDRKAQLAAVARQTPMPSVATPAPTPAPARIESRSPTRASGPTSARIGADSGGRGFFAITPLKIILGLVLAGLTYLILSNAHIELFPCTITSGVPAKTVDGTCSLLGASYAGTQLTGAGWAVVAVVSGLIPLCVGFVLGGLFGRRGR